MTAPVKSEQDRVVIFDTTLRDGEQCPGATMTHEEKLEVAELLDQMGVDIIEAGFPIASDGDFAAVHEIAKRTNNAVVCGLARAAFKDIDRCAEAVKPAKRSRIHTFISTSPVHMKYKLQKEPHEVYELVIARISQRVGITFALVSQVAEKHRDGRWLPGVLAEERRLAQAQRTSGPKQDWISSTLLPSWPGLSRPSTSLMLL